jgi:hypothetical protein
MARPESTRGADSAGLPGPEYVVPPARELKRERKALLQVREERLRDLGGLALEMYKRDRFTAGLVVERCAELVAIEVRVQEIDALLDGTAGLRRGGGGASASAGRPASRAHFCGMRKPVGGSRRRRGHRGATNDRLSALRQPSARRQGTAWSAASASASERDGRRTTGSGWMARAAIAAVVALIGGAAAVTVAGGSRTVRRSSRHRRIRSRAGVEHAPSPADPGPSGISGGRREKTGGR